MKSLNCNQIKNFINIKIIIIKGLDEEFGL